MKTPVFCCIFVVFFFGRVSFAQSPPAEGRAESVESTLRRAQELAVRSLANDADRLPFLGHYMQDAVQEWERLPRNVLREQMLADLQRNLTDNLRKGIAARNKVFGIVGAPELRATVGVGVNAGVSVSVGTSTVVPTPGAGYRDAAVRYAAAREPLLQPIRNPEVVAKRFFDLISTDADAAQKLLPLAESLFTVHPLTGDPEIILNKDLKLQLEEREKGVAQQIRELRQQINQLSTRERSQTDLPKEDRAKLRLALQKHRQLSRDLNDRLQLKFKEYVGDLASQLGRDISGPTVASASSSLNSQGLKVLEKSELERAEKIARAYRNLEDWTKGVSAVATMIDARTGATIESAGHLVLSAAALYYAPSFASLGSFVGAYSSLVQGLLGGTPDVGQERHAEIMAALGAIDRKVTQISTDIDRGFATLQEQIVSVNRQVFALGEIVSDAYALQRTTAVFTASQLGRMESALIGIDSKMDTQSQQRWMESRESMNQSVSLRILEAGRLDVMYGTRPLAERQSIANSALAAFITHADQGSAPSVQVGLPTVRPILSRSGELDVQAPFAPLASALKERGAVNCYATLASALGIAPVYQIRNPEEYLRGTFAAMYLPETWPAEYPRLTADQRKILREAGSDILDLQSEFVARNRVRAVGQGRALAMQRVVDEIRNWAKSDATLRALGITVRIDLLRGPDQFLSPAIAGRLTEKRERVDVLMQLEALSTTAPQFNFPPKQVYWENQDAATPLQIESVDQNSPQSWSRMLGFNENRTLSIDPYLIQVNGLVSSVLALRGQATLAQGAPPIGTGGVEAYVDLRPSAYNAFRRDPFRNIISVSISPAYRFVVTAGEPKFRALTITSYSDRAIKIYDKVYERTFAPIPGTDRTLTPEQLANVTMNGNLRAEVQAYGSKEIQADTEAGLMFLMREIEKSPDGEIASALGKLGTLQLHDGKVVFQAASIDGVPDRINGEREIPFQGTYPNFQLPRFTLSLTGSAGRPEEAKLAEAQQDFIVSQQRAALSLLLKEATHPTTSLSKSIRELEAANLVIAQMVHQGAPALVLEAAEVQTALYEASAPQSFFDAAFDALSRDDTVGKVVSVLVDDQKRDSKILDKALERFSDRGAEQNSIVGLPALRWVLKELK